MKHKKSNFI